MLCFREWLLIVEGRAGVPGGVLAGYEVAFKDQLRGLIRRTQNPALRAKLYSACNPGAGFLTPVVLGTVRKPPGLFTEFRPHLGAAG
jgi:hypothetical protein